MQLLMRAATIVLVLVAAIVPSAAYAFLVWRIDRYEKEPIKLLAATYLWGAVPAVLLAVIVELLFDAPILLLSQGYGELVTGSFVAPPVEESLKAVALLGVYALGRYEFDGVLDGIIYGSVIGFGFAMTENLFYYLGTLGENDLAALTSIIIGRAVLFGFTHAMFTSFTGIGFGLARYAKTRRARWILILLGLLAATTAHLLHNLFLNFEDLCLISFALDWLGVVVVFVIIALAWRKERIWMRTYLKEEADLGVLTAPLLKDLVSRRRRLRQSWGALGGQGAQKARLWRKLYQAATELAFKKHQRQSLGDEKGNSRAIARQRATILDLRARLGDDTVASARVCPECGRPSWTEGQECAYCGSTPG